VSRRARTLIPGVVILAILIILAATLPVPYVVLSPGPTLNTLGTYETPKGSRDVITITGRESNKTSGNLNLTTVESTVGRISAFQALMGWIRHDEVVVPRETIYPPGVSQKDVDRQDAQDFSDSQNSAIAAAFCELGYPRGFGVLAVSSEVKPKGALQVGDQLLTLAGEPVTDLASLLKVEQKHKAGDTVEVGIKRLGEPMTVSVVLNPPVGKATNPTIGIIPGQTCFATYKVTLGLNNSIGGPSAGLMFALGIMDKVGDTNITQGRFIAGTGTIDPAGKVGPIGGIQLKMIAARRAGATVFLAPESNCADVHDNIPTGLEVVKVSTLRGAVTDLEQIKSGQHPAGCG
jgi:PDZ domain-containing protein